MRIGPSLSDWYVVIVGAIGTVAGTVIGTFKHDRQGWGCAVFFAGCLAIGIRTVMRKRRIRLNYAVRDVQVRGGVHIQAPRSTGLIWTGSVAVVGFALYVLGLPNSWFADAFAIGLASVGTILFAILALGISPRPALMFEPDGVRWLAGQRSYLLEWDNIARAWPGEMQGQDLLLIEVRDVDRLCRTASPEYAKRLPKLIGSNRAWYNADLAIAPVTFGLDVALLSRTMRRYVESPASRAELAAAPPLTP